MSHKLPGLFRRHNTWMVRKGVPAAVRGVIGKPELLRSLKTGDITIAKKLHPAVWAEFNQVIAEARGLKSPASKATLDIHGAELALAAWGGKITDDPAKWLDAEALSLTTAPMMKAMILGYEHMFATGDPSMIPDGPLPPLPEMTRRMLAIGGMHVAAGHPIIEAMEQRAAMHLATAYRYLERERLTRAVAAMPLDDVIQVIVEPKPSTPPAMKLSALYEAWKATLEKVADKELGRLDHQQRRLIETVGDIPANFVTKAMIAEHMRLVARFPARRSSALNALSMRDLVEQFEAENAKRPEAEKHATLTAFTAAEWFSGYRRMFSYGRRNEHLTKDPTEDIAIDVVRGGESKARRAFTKEEIEKLFGTPLFRGYDPSAAKGQRNTAGAVVTRDSKYWLPIIALLHGARLSEMAAMPLADIRQAESGDWYFDLTDRRVKTAASRRLIPCHPQLVALGFIEHVEELRKANETWLFPDLDHKAKVGPGHGFSKWFGRWTGQIGLTDPSITFHSFRHTWKRRARGSDVKEERHDILSGHKPTSVGRVYGEGSDITPLVEDMAKITFPELTLEKVAV